MQAAYFYMTVVKVGEHWKLQAQRLPLYAEYRRIEITVKHVGSDAWTPVQLFPCAIAQGLAPNQKLRMPHPLPAILDSDRNTVRNTA